MMHGRLTFINISEEVARQQAIDAKKSKERAERAEKEARKIASKLVRLLDQGRFKVLPNGKAVIEFFFRTHHALKAPPPWFGQCCYREFAVMIDAAVGELVSLEGMPTFEYQIHDASFDAECVDCTEACCWCMCLPCCLIPFCASRHLFRYTVSFNATSLRAETCRRQ